MLFPISGRPLIASSVAALSLLIAPAAFSQTSFSAHTLYNSSDYVSVIAHGDFNNDGREDFIVRDQGNSGSQNLLLLSNGDGTYDAPVTLPSVAGGIGTLVVGDFNHDGNLDYAVMDYAAQGVDIWQGHGDGTFTNPSVLSTNPGVVAIAAVDLNHDNCTDIVVIASSGGYGNIQTWPSHCGAYMSFDAGQYITSGVIVGTSAASGDFDGDGKPDLAIVNDSPGATTVQVWYGDGKGNLGSPTQLTDPNGYQDSWSASAIGDIDNNGTSDLVMPRSLYGSSGTSVNYQQIAVFKGNSNRTLSFSTIATAGGCPGYPIGIADLNGDGLNDLVYAESPCTTSGNTNIVVNPATSSGVFNGSEQTIYTTAYQVPGGPIAIVKSTQGTKPDLVLPAYTSAPSTSGGVTPTQLVLLSNNTSGSFPSCGTTTQSEGINLCMPSGASANSPVQFSISASGPTPMRTVAVWADGQKVSEQLTHAFSNYSFLDQSVALSQGSHSITIFGTGWDDTLQSKTFTLDVGGSSGCGAPSSPGVNVCKPVNASTVGSPTEVSAAANITGTLAAMEIWVDGTKMYTESTSTSFDTSLTLANGYHRFDIYAVNTAGTKWETTVYATVGTASSCASPSSYGVNVCSPANNSTGPSPVQVTATASISGSLARMEVWVDGIKEYTETTSLNLSTSIALGPGTHQFDIYAVNTAGTKYETTVFATVGSASSCPAGSGYGVHVCSPTNGSTVSSPVQTTATATISGTLARMEVWVDGVKEYTETTGLTLDTSVPLGSGKHQFDFYAVNTAGTKWETTVFATVP